MDKKQYIVTTVIVVLIVISITGYYIYQQYYNKPVHQIKFHGLVLNFRSDLREAAKVESFPDDESIAEMLLDSKIQNITFGFPNETDAGIYGVVSYGLAFKLTVIYNSIYSSFSNPTVEEYKNTTCIYYKDFDKRICFKKKIVDNVENISSNKGEVFIYLKKSKTEPRVIVEKDKNLIIVTGSTKYDGKDYTGLDLAAEHLILVLLSHIK